MARKQATICTHRWMLGDPGFRQVRGVCRRCGARKLFPSGLEIMQVKSEFEELAASHPVFPAGSASPEEPVYVQGWRAVSLS